MKRDVARLSRLGALSAALLVASPTAAAGIEILSPGPGAIVQPGSSVTFHVGPSAGESVGQVAFATSEGVTVAPPGTFQSQVRIPLASVGPTFVVAYATLVGGGVAVKHVQLTADPGSLDGLIVVVPSRMARVGQVFRLEVSGRFQDGVVRDLGGASLGTTYQTTNPDVLGVHPSGLIQARSRGSAQVVVSSHGRQTAATVRVDVPSQPDNRIPISDPGPDRVVPPQTLVELSGAASSDPDGDPISSRWEQTRGRVVILRDAETGAPFFASPRVSQEEVLEFSLVVTDSKGASSLPATVRITVRP